MTFMDTGAVRTPEPQTVTLDGQTYRLIERLPRNVRVGDVIRIGDMTTPVYHCAYVTVTNVDSWPTETRGGRCYGPTARISFKLRPKDAGHFMWTSWRNEIVYRESETRERIKVYRAVQH